MAGGRTWREDLIQAYPDIFHPTADNPGVAQASPECGEGWRDLLERACVRIRAAVQAGGGSFKATQIKEKFGTLRFYWDGPLSPEAAARVDDAIDLAEARSACTCETCGAPGRLFADRGWLATACDLHAVGKPVPVRPGRDNLLVVSGMKDGKLRVVSCRRYDRETDSFTDVDPSELGIEE